MLCCTAFRRFEQRGQCYPAAVAAVGCHPQPGLRGHRRRREARREESRRAFGGGEPRVAPVFPNEVAAVVIAASPPRCFGLAVTFGAIWLLCGTPGLRGQPVREGVWGFPSSSVSTTADFWEPCVQKEVSRRAAVSTCDTDLLAVTSVDIAGQRWGQPSCQRESGGTTGKGTRSARRFRRLRSPQPRGSRIF